MKLTLVERPLVPPSASPYRLLDERGQEVAWANAFLDAQRIRQLSLRSLRAYAYDLLHFARWFQDSPRPLSQISQSTLLDYVRHESIRFHVNDPVKTGFSVTPAGIARQDRHRRCDPSVNGQALVWKWCSFVEGGME